MWAMIGTCSALGLWTTGLLWMTVRAEKRKSIESGENSEVKNTVLEPANRETLDEKV